MKKGLNMEHLKEKVIVDGDTLTAIHFKWELFDDKVYSVEFQIYDISWVTMDREGRGEYPKYHNLEDHHNNPSYHKPSEHTKPKIEGWIKWDGCCNYKYNEQDYMHMCGLDGFKDELEQIEKAYQISAEIMGDRADLEMMGLKK